MTELTLCVLYISLYKRKLLLHKTGSAIDEDGSHHQLPYWDYFNANNFTLGALWAFSPIYFGSREGPVLSQDKLFWKLPSPLSEELL